LRSLLSVLERDEDGSATRPARLTTAPESDFNVRGVSDAEGNFTITWQSFRKGNADIYVRRLTGCGVRLFFVWDESAICQ